jgi:hypothetical protein
MLHTRNKSPTRCNSVTEFIIPLMSIVQHVSSVMSLIIRNLNRIWASGLQTLVETARGAVWVGTVCKPEAQIQLRFLMMSDITLETRWTIDISEIINSITELHLVGDLLLVILRCTVPWIINIKFINAAYSPLFSSKCRLCHNGTFFGSCIIHILHTGCAKI